MINYNGTSNLFEISNSYRKQVTLRFDDLLTIKNNIPNWEKALRIAHHTLKDKGLIQGVENGEWSLTPLGYNTYDFFLDHILEFDVAFLANDDWLTYFQQHKLFSLPTKLIPFDINNNFRAIVMSEENTPELEVVLQKQISTNDSIIFYLDSVVNAVASNIDSIEKFQFINLRNIEPGFNPTFIVTEEEYEIIRSSNVVNRRMRDTRLTLKIKNEYNHQCQICGLQIILGNGRSFSEAHHLMPIGKPHNGPDVLGNLIILCSNHHTEFDGLAIAINPSTGLIEHMDTSNECHNKKIACLKHEINFLYIHYHYELFKKQKTVRENSLIQ